ncbi:YadA-like family protein, partial [Burkholderia cenocepacia]|uniref:YadA-like family protein n=1 Tax=Burkholderia cenocepacia TaxID=95486 RepID=UPI000980ED8A
DSDAVNVGQMNAGLSTTNAAIAATNAGLSTTNTNLAETKATLSTTSTQVAELGSDMTIAKDNIATHTTEIKSINDQLSELSSGTIGLVQQSAAGDDLTVGANTDGAAVNFAGTAGDRKLSGIAEGTLDSDAVNVGQMNAGLSTTNAAIAATNAGLSTTNTNLAETKATLSTTSTQVAELGSDMTIAKDNIATHTTEIKSINDQLSELSSGTIGLVQQSAAGDDLTVGANTDGAAVNFAGTAGDRKLSGIAEGTLDSDAVNVGQMNAGLSTTNAAIAATNAMLSTTNATLSTTNTTLADTNATLSTANTQIAALNGDMTTAKDNIATHTTEIKSINDQLSDLSSGTIGLVQQSAAGADLTVGANTDGAAVNFAGTAGDRKLSGIATGTLDSDAVNVGQMNAGLSTTNAAITATNAELSTTNTTLAATNTALSTTNTNLAETNATLSTTSTQVAELGSDMTIAKDNITQHTTEIKSINDQLSELSSGTIGLVQQSAAGADLTVGANTDGAAVNFAGTAGDRKLSGIATGTLDSDAVNVGQMNAGLSTTNASITSLDGRVTSNETTITNLDGRVTNNETAITNLDGRVTSNETAITNLDGRVTNNETSITNLDGRMTTSETAITNIDNRVTINEGAITKLADEIGSGSLGLVRQANAGADLTVGANADGAAVNFAGTAGNRKLSGIAEGTLDSDAVNVGQMNAGLSTTNASITSLDGRVTNNETSITNLDGRMTTSETTITNIDNRVTANEGSITSLDNRVTVNEGAITKLADQIGSGSLGLVQQASAGDDLTVGANTDGAAVNFAGTAGNRKLTGVDAGAVSAASTEAINGMQLHGVSESVASALGGTSTVDADGKLTNVSFDINGTKYSTVEQAIQAAAAFGASDPLSVRYDLNGDGTPNFGSVTLGGIGAAPVILTNVADGVNPYDAVNFGQLSALNDKFSDLDGRVGSLEQNAGGSGPGGPGDGSGTPGTGGPGSIVVGDGADASGANSSAIGQGAVASGNNGSAVGQGAIASGNNGTAIGQGSLASGENSTALGQGASATGSGSVAIGQGSVATETNTVSFGNGTEEGNRRLVNIADGINASDAATKGQLDRAMESVDARFNDTNRAINDVAKNAYAGIAAAMAMPNMTPSAPGKTVVAVGTANFKSGSAIAAGATYRSRNGKWLVNGAASLTSVGDAGVRAQVGYEF